MHEVHGMVAIVPAVDLDTSAAFYEQLGLRASANFPDNGYRILHDDRGASLHLTRVAPDAVEPKTNAHGVYFYAENVRELAAALNLHAETKPWGMIEFALSDPCGTLVRIGWPVD
jgi:hypothetical protein